jgi:16S rRNA (guanine1207-N2)-methyltransferase
MGNNQYFENVPTSERRPQEVRVHVRGVDLAITTDSGVFSKKGLDFGSRLLIETVQLPETGTVVDLGCGYGVIAAALGQVYPSSDWVLLDVNQRAVELAVKNTSHLGSRVRAYQSDGFAANPNLRAEAIVLNPPIRAGKSVIYRLFEEAKAHLNPGGCLWIVIHKKHGAASAKAKLATLFDTVELVARESGYHVFKSQ